jgi:hypothetical protein
VSLNIRLCQLDGHLPNLALMRIAAHHSNLGDKVEIRHGADFRNHLWDTREPDLIYASAIFRKTIPLAERLLAEYPRAILGGTGVDPARLGEIVPLSSAIRKRLSNVEDYGILSGESSTDFDYSIYPRFTASIGFTQRGCRKRCPFCCVWQKEPVLKNVNTVYTVWRGDPWPRHLHLLDNDFFGQPGWADIIREIREGDFKVSFNQGINARFLTDETAAAIASVDYRDDNMKVKRIYTAWDNRKDEDVLFGGLDLLAKYGVNPDHIMVYMLIGYWPGETMEDCDYRRRRLREFGARPYPMPSTRTQELVGFQRWVIGAYDKPSKKHPDGISWSQWKDAGYRPEGMGEFDDNQLVMLS